MSFVEFQNVKKIYHMGEVEIQALRGVDFQIEKGEFCVVVGASGAGKTTILNILGGMDTLSEGGFSGWERDFFLRQKEADRIPPL